MEILSILLVISFIVLAYIDLINNQKIFDKNKYYTLEIKHRLPVMYCQYHIDGSDAKKIANKEDYEVLKFYDYNKETFYCLRSVKWLGYTIEEGLKEIKSGG